MTFSNTPKFPPCNVQFLCHKSVASNVYLNGTSVRDITLFTV